MRGAGPSTLIALALLIPGRAVAQHHDATAPYPRTSTLMLGIETGVSHAFSEDRSSITANAKPGGSLDLSVLWRSVKWVAVGIQLGFAGLPAPAPDASTAWVTSALVQARFMVPVQRLDLWADLGVGFGGITQKTDFVNADRISMLGPGLAVGLGVDIFLNRTVSVGAAFRMVRIFTGQYCVDGVCAQPGQGLDPGVLWRAILSFTYHLPVRFGTASH